MFYNIRFRLYVKRTIKAFSNEMKEHYPLLMDTNAKFIKDLPHLHHEQLLKCFKKNIHSTVVGAVLCYIWVPVYIKIKISKVNDLDDSYMPAIGLVKEEFERQIDNVTH